MTLYRLLKQAIRWIIVYLLLSATLFTLFGAAVFVSGDLEEFPTAALTALVMPAGIAVIIGLFIGIFTLCDRLAEWAGKE